MSSVDDWIEEDGIHKWIHSCDGMAEVLPFKHQNGITYLQTASVSGSSGVMSRHSHRQLSLGVPRYRQHTIASSLKQRVLI